VTVVYGVALAVGMAALVGWIAAGSSSASGRLDPERRLGTAGRAVVAALVGFGMGGLSAAFAGWPIAGHVAAALAGALVMAAVAVFLGPARTAGESDSGRDG